MRPSSVKSIDIWREKKEKYVARTFIDISKERRGGEERKSTCLINKHHFLLIISMASNTRWPVRSRRATIPRTNRDCFKIPIPRSFVDRLSKARKRTHNECWWNSYNHHLFHHQEYLLWSNKQTLYIPLFSLWLSKKYVLRNPQHLLHFTSVSQLLPLITNHRDNSQGQRPPLPPTLPPIVIREAPPKLPPPASAQGMLPL